MGSDVGLRTTTALLWGIAAAMLMYALLRAKEVLTADPGLVPGAFSAQIAYFWRIDTVAFGGGFAAVVAFVVTRDRTAGALQGVRVALAIAAGCLAVQSIVMP